MKPGTLVQTPAHGSGTVLRARGGGMFDVRVKGGQTVRLSGVRLRKNGRKKNPKDRTDEERAILMRERLERMDEAAGDMYKPDWSGRNKKAHAYRLRLAGLNQKLGRGMAETTGAWRSWQGSRRRKNPVDPLWGATLPWIPADDFGGRFRLVAQDGTEHWIQRGDTYNGGNWAWAEHEGGRLSHSTRPVRNEVKLVRAAEKAILKDHGGPRKTNPRRSARKNPSMSEEQAATLLKQLGGHRRLVLMTGAYNFLRGSDAEGHPYLSFRIKNKRGPNYVQIVYHPGKDTYSMSFSRVHGMDLYPKGKVDDVYADALVRTFEKKTGLYLTM